MARNNFTPEQAQADFHARLDIQTSPCPVTGCWWWVGTVTRGYGRISLRGDAIAAHRASYERYRGAIPDGMQIDHLCRNTLCVNPDHLEVVTLVENVMRGVSLPALNATKTHCVNGHNEWRVAHESRATCRVCRACVRDRARRYYHRDKESHNG